MSLKKTLDHALAALPECRTVAYIDMPAGLVLASASRARLRQEHLDRLSAAAAALLDSPSLGLLRPQGTDAGDPVLLVGQDEVHCFVRTSSFPDHALCYSCSADAVSDDLMRRIGLHRDQVAAAM